MRLYPFYFASVLRSPLAIGALIFCYLFSMGCAHERDPYLHMDENAVYASAQKKISRHRFQAALKDLEYLETRYPFGPHAQRVQLALIYVYFKEQSFEEALSQSARFLRLYPSSPHVDYVYFMKGMTHFQAAYGGFIRYFPVDFSERTQEEALRAYEDFEYLNTHFPHSVYRPKIQQQILLLKNRLAAHEYHIAQYYFEKEAYVAAAARARIILDHYPQSDAAPAAQRLWREALKALDFAKESACTS